PNQLPLRISAPAGTAFALGAPRRGNAFWTGLSGQADDFHDMLPKTGSASLKHASFGFFLTVELSGQTHATSHLFDQAYGFETLMRYPLRSDV
ncbi:MAG TPA: hypothetical protein VED85_07195, partial [Burkholderiaceae bacterium]|nr:hypothetical protein [Burkholderiaceae bacterium]